MRTKKGLAWDKYFVIFYPWQILFYLNKYIIYILKGLEQCRILHTEDIYVLDK